MNAKHFWWPLLVMAMAGCVGKSDLEHGPSTPGEEPTTDISAPQYAEPPQNTEDTVYGPVGSSPTNIAPPFGTVMPTQPEEPVDAGTPAVVDAGTPPVLVDAGTPPVVVDAGTPPAVVDAGTPSNPPDADTTTPPSSPQWTKDWFVSGTTGNDNNTGTSSSPFKTINRAIRAASPGHRILIGAGTYREQILIDSTKPAGTAASPILLQGIDKPKIVPPGTQALAVVSRPYWIIDGFDFDAEDVLIPGIVYLGNSTGNILRYNLIHGGRRNGIVVHEGGNGVTIENNQIYDWWHDTEDAHGIGLLWTAKNITIRHNKIFQNSGDAIQCEGPEPYGITDPPADGVLIENNEMTNDKENAVDIKTCWNVTVRNNWAHDYRRQGGAVFIVHMSAKNVFIENNLVENIGKMLALGGNRSGPMPAGVVVRKNRVKNVLSGMGLDGVALDGRAMVIANSEGAIISNNTLTGVSNIGIYVGEGTNGPSNNLLLQNNIVSGPRPLKTGPYAPGLISKTNLIDTNHIETPSGVLTVTQWQAAGVDTGSKSITAPLCDANFVPVTTAVDTGTLSGLPYCGSAPDIGAVETGC